MGSDEQFSHTLPEEFSVVFRGLREGHDLSFVKAQFAELFKVDSVKVDRIFSAKRVTLKNRVSERVANIFVARLLAIGVLADKVSLAPTVTAMPVPSKAIYSRDYGEESADAGSMHQDIAPVYGEHIIRIPLQFTGSGLQYAKLWIVNVLIFILSAGMLFPWVQVRALRYFYQHTQLDSGEFSYRSHPQKIFLFQAAFLLYSLLLVLSFFLAPVYFLFGMLALLTVLPLYLHKRIFFHVTHSCYRGVALQHQASIGSAYRNYLLWPMVLVLSAGLLAPLALFNMQRYFIETKSFGGFPLVFSASLRSYFQLLPPVILANLLTFSLVHWSEKIPFLLDVICLIGIWVWVFIRWRVTLINLLWNAVSSPFGYFKATWDIKTYSQLIMKSIVYCVITLGGYWPWARVNLAKYKTSHLAFMANQRFRKWHKNLD